MGSYEVLSVLEGNAKINYKDRFTLSHINRPIRSHIRIQKKDNGKVNKIQDKYTIKSFIISF